MSILVKYADVFILGLLLIPSALLAARLKVFRASAVVGPLRVGPREPAWPLLVALALGFGAWIWTQALFVSWWMKEHASPATRPVRFDPSSLSAGGWAFLSTVPPLVGFVMLLVADAFLGDMRLLDRLGLRADRFRRGALWGLWAAVVVLPPTYLAASLTEMAYRRLHFQHPAEHDLLKAMGVSIRAVTRWLLIAGAVVAAPLFEEFLFRGHIQTLVLRVLMLIDAPRPGALGFAPVMPGQALVETAPALDPRLAPPPARAWQSWAAIVITSLLFAAVHPMWMFPPIFFLSLGLGYCYERTGNLWVNITVHCLFNSVSTFLYLKFIHP